MTVIGALPNLQLSAMPLELSESKTGGHVFIRALHTEAHLNWSDAAAILKDTDYVQQGQLTPAGEQAILKQRQSD